MWFSHLPKGRHVNWGKIMSNSMKRYYAIKLSGRNWEYSEGKTEIGSGENDKKCTVAQW